MKFILTKGGYVAVGQDAEAGQDSTYKTPAPTTWEDVYNHFKDLYREQDDHDEYLFEVMGEDEAIDFKIEKLGENFFILNHLTDNNVTNLGPGGVRGEHFEANPDNPEYWIKMERINSDEGDIAVKLF
eukprot:UC4_evm1s1346